MEIVDESKAGTTDQSRPPAPSLAVVEAVADAEGCDPRDLDPIANVVDPDALDAVLGEVGAEVTFSYEGYRVTVTSAGDVRVDPAPATR